MALRRKVAALRRSKRPAQTSRPRASAQLRKALDRARKQKDTIKALRGETGSLSREARRLHREQGQLQDLKATVRRMTAEAKLLRGELAGYHDQMALIESQSWRIFHLERALRKSATQKEELEARLAERPLLSAVFRTVRDRNRTIESLHREIAGQRKTNARQDKKTARLREANAAQGKKIKALRALSASLEARIVQLRSSRAVLSKAVFGSRSEKQETPRSERGRGQQRGRARSRPYPAACARREGGTAGAAGGRSHVFLLRQALCRERRAFLVRHRDRGQGPYPQDRAPALPPGVRLRVLAPGSDRAPAGAAVPQDALRDQRLDAHPVRTLCLLPPFASGRVVDGGPGAGDRAGDHGRQRAPLPASVRAARRGDPRPPERDGGAPRRRDRLAHPRR